MSTIDNINGIYAKDTELRNGISELRGDILSQTIKPLSITKNGTYTSDPTVGAYGYSPIIVDVQEEPWQPLEDGYSNFWFELTNDTLSPWLNFSAKTENAVIDWGDGSGEVALDTLTPTHTYSKAGRYVVKVKGVTGIAAQHTAPYSEYVKILVAMELNNEVTTISNSAFFFCERLKSVDIRYVTSLGTNAFAYCSTLDEIIFNQNLSTIPEQAFQFCFGLHTINLPNASTLSGSVFNYCRLLNKVTIPSSVESIGNYVFRYCSSLREVHCQATTPPTLGSDVFQYAYADFIIYVPVSTGDTYKAASGWSTYADHILEEGQTPNRMMLAKFNSDNTDNEEMR